MKYLLASLCLALLCSLAVGADPPTRIFIGTYTGSGSGGIYVAEWDNERGRISDVRLAGQTTNPSFLALHPTRPVLYSVKEVAADAKPSGAAVQAWSIGPDGALSPLNRMPAGGDSPCYVTVDNAGRLVAIANYGGGSVGLYRLDDRGNLDSRPSFVQHTGRSVNPRRQTAPHAHCARFSPDGTELLVADLGIDKVLVYPVRDGQLIVGEGTAIDIRPGGGPRHLALSSDGERLLVINELSSQLDLFRYAGERSTLLASASTLPADYRENNSTAEVLLHPNGRFAYASNRGHDTIAVFDLGDSRQSLRRIANVAFDGATPRNFRISPDGQWMIVAGQQSDTLTVMKINAETGIPELHSDPLEIAKPVCVKFWSPNGNTASR